MDLTLLAHQMRRVELAIKCASTEWGNMRSNRLWAYGLFLPPVVVALAGCATPFAEVPRYDMSVRNAEGSISLSDAKVYTREALISERAADVAWINGLIKESENPEKIQFTPDIVREVEQISAFAAGLGLKFDPAAAVNYQRNQETGEIQQEIAVMRLQLQLEQLRRDAELFRARLIEQTEVATANLGAVGSADPAAASSAVSASAANQLEAAIDNMMTTLTSRFGADVKGPLGLPAGMRSSPIDDFRDRTAYRDLLKSARNAAGLDDLHDAGGNQLIRLNFQATAIPDRKNLRSLGIVEVSIDRGAATKSLYGFLQRALRVLNGDPKYRDETKRRFLATELVARLAATGNFQLVTIGSDRENSLDILAPVQRDVNGSQLAPQYILSRASWVDAQLVESMERLTSAIQNDEVAGSSVVAMAACKDEVEGWGQQFRFADELTRFRLLSHHYFLIAREASRSLGVSINLPAEFQNTYDRSTSLRNRLDNALSRADCKLNAEEMANLPTNPYSDWAALPPVGDLETLVRVYEVGPREQAQQISTQARAANSLALAASIAASAPGSGQAADAALGYSRQATGKAAALERVPSVVGYVPGGTGIFGWVIAPKATVDPKGELSMEQMLRPYDLTVDLSVPGWWTHLPLKVRRVWAPSPLAIANGHGLDSDAENSADKQKKTFDLTVPLPQREDAMKQFVETLLPESWRPVTIDNFTGGKINACNAVDLYLEGENLWRAEAIMVMGKTLRGDAIRIAPDMRGIFVTVPPITDKTLSDDRLVRVFTRYREAVSSKNVAFDDSITGDACQSKKEDVVDPDAVVIETFSPDDISVPSAFDLVVTGKNLKKIVEVTLGAQVGTIKPEGNDGSIRVIFTRDNTSSINSSVSVPLMFYQRDKDGKLQPIDKKSRTIRVTRTTDGGGQ